MENDNILQQFEAIEKKVERLITANQALTAANGELNAKVARLSDALQEKNENENQQDAVRTQIRSKIESLLVRLEDIAEV